ncbi:MAG: peptidylprolyl isomerase [Chloroflexi bacterium]|nr:peptidylprolyl isomerase [Chloroflexota bacterium]
MRTDAGAIYIDLFQDQTPITVNNFVFLAYNGYYNNKIFHRVIEAFMAQGGDPTGTGGGGPGYQFADEFEPYLYFDRIGACLRWRMPALELTDHNFSLATELILHLDYRHTIFGEVLEGYDKVAEKPLRDPEAGGDATALKTVLVVRIPRSLRLRLSRLNLRLRLMSKPRCRQTE